MSILSTPKNYPAKMTLLLNLFWWLPLLLAFSRIASGENSPRIPELPSEALYGFELEFRHPIQLLEIPLFFLVFPEVMISQTSGSLALAMDISSHVLKNWNSEVKKEFSGSSPPHLTARFDQFRVHSESDWWWEAKRDWTVAEVVAPPKPLSWYEQKTAKLQSEIFDTAANAGLAPPGIGNVFGGAGHLNIDIESAFHGNPVWLVNFIVDFANHSELATGVLNHDFYNAGPLKSNGRMIPLQRFVNFCQSHKNLTTEDVIRAYQSIMQEGGHKNLALAIPDDEENSDVKPGRKPRLEIRSLRAPRNAAEAVRRIKIFDGRIKFLQSRSGFINLNSERPTLKPESAARAFFRYITESNLDWEDYRADIPWRYRQYRFDSEGNTIKKPTPLLRCMVYLSNLVPM